MLQKNGFTVRVCDDFVDRVERTVWAGEIPEQKMTMTLIDNSGDDPVQGYVRDVTYTLEIPVVMKWEKEEADDKLQIVGVMLAIKKILDIDQVKTEKTTPPASPKKGMSREPGEPKNASPQKVASGEPGEPKNAFPQESTQKSSQKVASGDTGEQKNVSPQKATTEEDAQLEDLSPQKSPQKAMTEKDAQPEDVSLQKSSPQKSSPWKEKAKPKKHKDTEISQNLKKHTRRDIFSCFP